MNTSVTVRDLTDEEVAEFLDWFHDLGEFPYPKNWQAMCNLCRLKYVAAKAEEHGRVAELVAVTHSSWGRPAFTGLNVNLKATKTKDAKFIFSTGGSIPFICECDGAVITVPQATP